MYLKAIALIMLCVMLNLPVFSQENSGQVQKAEIENLISNSESFFIENKGQWPEHVYFFAKGKNYRTWITKNSMIFEQFDFHSQMEENVNANAVALMFENEKDLEIQTKKTIGHKTNYLLGDDVSKHVQNACAFEEVVLKNIYEGIDIRYYFENGNIRYDFIVQPYANPDLISMQIMGAKSFELIENELCINTSLKPIIQKDLIVHQNNNIVSSNFYLNEDKLKINIGNYDIADKLIIDPISIVDSAYVYAASIINDVVVDDSNNVYFCGATDWSTFPANLGEYLGTIDMIIGKYTRNQYGSLIHNWTTFYGGRNSCTATGSACINQHLSTAKSLQVDDNFVYFTGVTTHEHYPIVATNPLFHMWGSFANVFTVLSLDGTTTKYSTYLSNFSNIEYAYLNKYLTGSEHYRNFFPAEIEVASNGNIYLIGAAYNDNALGSNFSEYKEISTQSPAYSIDHGFVIGLEPSISGSTLDYSKIFSTLFGGDKTTIIRDLDIDEDENIYITGSTKATPTSFKPTIGAYDETIDANGHSNFIAKLFFDVPNDELAIEYLSYFGDLIHLDPEYEEGVGAQTIMYDNNKIYIGGYVKSHGIPMVNGYDMIFSTSPRSRIPREAFISVFKPEANGVNDLFYSSYFGGTGNSAIFDLEYLNECDRLVFTGYTTSEIPGNVKNSISSYIPVNNQSAMTGIVNIYEESSKSLKDIGYYSAQSVSRACDNNPYNWSSAIYSAVDINNLGYKIYQLEVDDCSLTTSGSCPCLSDRDIWLSVGLAQGCDDDATQCQVIHRLDIPEENQCYDWYELSTLTTTPDPVYIQDPEYPNDPTKLILVSSVTNVLSTYGGIQGYNGQTTIPYVDQCLSPGESFTVYIKLYRMYNDSVPCILKQTVTCTGNPEENLPTVCEPDANCSDGWILPSKTLTSTFDDCGSTCEVTATYTHRNTCNGKQDLQIRQIQIDGDCALCNTEDIYEKILADIINYNAMGFLPENEGDCFDTWRIGMSSCLAEWQYYITNSDLIVKTVTVLEPCAGSECCMQPITVCKTATGVTITPDPSYSPTYTCVEVETRDYFGAKIDCFPACDWNANLDGSYGSSGTQGKKSIEDLVVNNKNAYGIKSYYNSDILFVDLRTHIDVDIKISIFDINGNKIKTKTNTISTGETNIEIPVDELQSGTYIYTIEIDGLVLETDKFVAVR